MKKTISLLLILFSIPLFANGYKDYISEGDKFYKRYDNFNALKNYELAYKEAPDDYEVMLKLARTYNDAGEELKELHRRDEAESYIKKAMNISEKFKNKFPDSAAVYVYLSFSYGNMAMYVGGKEKIKYANLIKDNAEKAVKMKPGDYLPYVILGIYNREIANLSWIERTFANTFLGDVPEGSNEQSIKMFNKALQLKPNMIVAIYGMSKTYRQMDNEKKEKELLQQVLKLPMQDFRDKFAKQKAKIRLQELGA